MLTVADIRAVGPGVWNGWKGQLLRELYFETEPVVAGGHTLLASRDRIAAAQATFRAAVSDWPPEEVERFVGRHYPDYWLRTETRKVVGHFKLVAEAEKAGEKLASTFTTDAFTAITELSLFAPNHPRLLAPCLPAPARPPAPTSRVRTSPRRATASPSTRSCSPASSTTTRTRCAARGASPTPSRSC